MGRRSCAGTKSSLPKGVMLIKPIAFFLRSRCRGLRSFVKSLMWARYGGKTRAAMSFLPLYRHPYSSTLIAIRDLQVFGWILTYRALKFVDIL